MCAAVNVVLCAAAGLLTVEVTLRLMVRFELFKPASRFVSILKDIEKDAICRPSQDPVLGYEFIPGSRRNYIRINSDGFRGREYSRQAPADTFRVAILGDSESVGLLLPEEHTLSACLTGALQEICGGKKIEVLEFGFPGYNARQKAKILEAKVLAYEPSVVVFYYVFNDPLPEANTSLIKPSLLLRSHAYIFFKYYLQAFNYLPLYQALHFDKTLIRYFQEIHASPDFEDCKRTIRRMGALLHGRDIRFIVAIAPELICYENFNEYPYRNIHEGLAELASAQIEVYDPLEALAASGYKPTELWVSPYDCHKGYRANTIIAKGLSKFIFPHNEG